MQLYVDVISGFNKVSIIATPHAPTVTQALESLTKKFKRRIIGQDERGYRTKKTDLFAITGPELIFKFSESFSSAIDALCTPSLFEAEFEYIKALPQYQAFLSSSLLKDLSSGIEHFVKNGYVYSPYSFLEFSFGVSDVHSCEFSAPNKNPFTFLLRFYQHEDTPYISPLNLLQNKTFRALSIPEISMLAIALSEKYPHLFTYTWTLYSEQDYDVNLLGDKKYRMTFEFGLTPCIVKEAPKPISEKKTEYIDIY